ncbi:MAG: hypothetical protein SFX72_07895 [Isosphaeraceae bacterium]|nr:hypothetical protein [Isosphaeraceae bacterium]
MATMMIPTTMQLMILLLGQLAAPGAPGTIDSPVGSGAKGASGDGGPAASARLDQPFDVAFDRAGNLFFSDTNNHKIRRVDARTGAISTVAGSGKKGFAGDGGPATACAMDEPYGLAIDADGTIYFADRLNARVRKIDAKSGMISTVAGGAGKTFSGDGGLASESGLVEPNGVALDGKGRLLIADVADHRIRAVDLATGRISTFAGDGKGRHAGDGGPAAKCSIFGARAVEVGPDGTVWILERQGNTLRSIDPATGIITRRAGTGKKGATGDGGPSLEATMNGPKELCLDARGRVLIVDTENQTIRRFDPSSGTITTVAGNGKRGGKGDGGPATAAELDRPHGVAVGSDGAIWIGDTNNHRLRRVAPEAADRSE